MIYLVKWGPDNMWGTAYGQRDRAERHASELRERWPDAEVVEMEL